MTAATPAPDEGGSDTPAPTDPGWYAAPTGAERAPATWPGAVTIGPDGTVGSGPAWAFPPPPRLPATGADRWWVRSLVGGGLAVVVALLGFPLGSLWSAAAPWVPGLVQSDGVYLADPEGEQRAAEEGWFIVLSVGTGVLLAILAWLLLRRFRGSITAVALGLGGVAAGWLTWRFGHNIGRGHTMELVKTAKIGDIVKFPVELRIRQPGDIARWHGIPYISGDLVLLGGTALLVYLLIVAFTASPALGVRRAVDRVAPTLEVDPVASTPREDVS